MLGVSGLMGNSGDGAAVAAADAHESGGASGGSSDVGASSSVPGGGLEESGGGGGGGGGGGNRWPRQETLALLKIRSEMDVTFRDSSLKGPLWEEVSRKMAELGFQRSAKKCKEKFENVYKYHKRTKDGRASKSDGGVGGKTYRFFDQLEALENTPPPPRPPPPNVATTLPIMPLHITVSSTSPNPMTVFPPTQTANVNIPISSPSSFQLSGQPLLQPPPPPPPPAAMMNPPQTLAFHPPSRISDTTSNSSTSSDEDIQRRRGKKRKWKDFFQRLMKDVIHKQEELQKKFLDTLEKRERDRMAREEAWRVQETARMNREHELLVQERSIAAAKDAAVVAFLQKVTEQHNFQIPIGNINTAPPPPMQVLPQPPQNPQPPPPRQPPQNPQPLPPPPPKPVASLPMVVVPTPTPTKTSDTSKTDNGSGGGGDNSLSASSSRWPKAEVEALIKLRTNLDLKYQENGPKGPLWEEISAAMAKIGYNRSSKRCKEKWENINKYFKKVKESNKKRPEDSKTCPYFHQLDAIYRERAKSDVVSFPGYAAAMNNPDNPMTAAPPIMARPENQWPLPDHQQQPHNDTAMADQYQDNESDHDEDEDDEEEDDDAQGYEVVTNKQPNSVTNTAE